MQISLKGKRAVVAGGSRGIGRSIALALAEAGAAVSICARGRGPLDKTSAEIAARGVKTHAGVCDLADKDAIATYVAAAADSLGGIDILVNNASGFGSTDDEDGWARSLDIDVMATVRASRAAIPFLELDVHFEGVQVRDLTQYHAGTCIVAHLEWSCLAAAHGTGVVQIESEEAGRGDPLSRRI